MNEFDDLFTENGEIGSDGRPFDVEAWAEKKKQERADAYELLDEGTLATVNNEEQFKAYLRAQAHLDRCSVGNAILISYQYPEATKVADFDTWKSRGAYIRRGEDAITMLEQGKEYTRDDGSIGHNVNVKKVFDISQTSMRSENEPPAFHDERSAIKALLSASPCAVIIDNEKTANVLARYSPDSNTIYIRQGLCGGDIFRSLSQEIAVARFAERDMSRKDCAFQAYCTSYILTERYGFEDVNYSFGNASERFAGMEPKEIRNDLNVIRNMANDISKDMMRQREAQNKANVSRDNGAR